MIVSDKEKSALKHIKEYYQRNYIKRALLLSFVLVLITSWDFSMMRYWKDLVVLIHEFFHAFMIVGTGGTVKDLTLFENQSGQVLSMGGWKFAVPFVYSSGYIGCVGLGFFLLKESIQEANSILIIRMLTIGTLVASLVFTETLSYAWNIGVGWSVIFFFISLSQKMVIDLFLVVLGTAISLYGMLDLKDFLFDLENTDAGILAQWFLSNTEASYSTDQVKLLGYFIASFIVVTNMTIMGYFFYKVFFYPRSKDEIALQKFIFEYKKGNIPEDVANWFLERDLSLDGIPISSHLIKEIKKKGDLHG